MEAAFKSLYKVHRCQLVKENKPQELSHLLYICVTVFVAVVVIVVVVVAVL